MSASTNRFFVVSSSKVILAAFIFAVSALVWQPAQLQSKAAVSQPAALGKLAFSRLDIPTGGGPTSRIATVNSDGTGEVTLAPALIPPLSNAQPAWSPDGTRIAYARDSDIWAMNADGSAKTNLTNNGPTSVEQNPSWSPGGKIAYERSGQIWTMNTDGSSQAPFSAITQTSPAAPAWSLDGTKLAFATAGEIWVINSDGSNERRVTNNASTDTDPAWSPDGTKIVFGKAGSGVAVINLDGSNEVPLTSNAQDGMPAWSNDGTKIAFARKGTSENGIYTMDAVGGNLLRIVADVPNQPGRNENYDPAWQPVAVTPNTSIISGRITRSGASLAGVTVNLTGAATLSTMTNSLGEYRFENLSRTGSYTITPTLTDYLFTPVRRIFVDPTSNRIADFAAGQTCSTPGCKVNGRLAFVRGSDIFVSAADGSNAVNITNGGGINEDPAFSPDGSRIVFRTNRDGNYEIYRMNIDGSNPQRLTNAAGTDEYPAYSSDGSKIVFVSDRDGNKEIYTINAVDGSNPQRLTTNSIPDDEPSFSADGTKIAFTRPFDGTPSGRMAIFTMNAADGSNPLQITTPPGMLSDLNPAFSPDGTKLVFRRYDSGPFTSSVFTANADGTSPVPIGITGFVFKPSFSPDGTRIVFSRFFFSASRYDVESIPVGGGGFLPMATNANHVDWQPVQPAVRPTSSDFDGDGRSDLSVFRPSNSVWYLLRSETGFAATQWGIATDTITPADFDGDKKTDIAVWRESDGNFYILNSGNNTFRIENFGLAGDIPQPQDWDGDSRADPSVFRSGAQGYFYYRGSANNPNRIITFVPWGTAGDKPVVGDFDGDALADATVFRPSNGFWYVLKSSDFQMSATNFGLANDKLIPADFDGDARTDIAVYRDGNWYLLRSTLGFSALQWGLTNDVPVPSDYDGDGRADHAVFRDGVWYCLRSTSGNLFAQFGLAGDKATQAAYVR